MQYSREEKIYSTYILRNPQNSLKNYGSPLNSVKTTKVDKGLQKFLELWRTKLKPIIFNFNSKTYKFKQICLFYYIFKT